MLWKKGGGCSLVSGIRMAATIFPELVAQGLTLCQAARPLKRRRDSHRACTDGGPSSLPKRICFHPGRLAGRPRPQSAGLFREVHCQPLRIGACGPVMTS